MKIFISWSGDLSRDVAKALHSWLPIVIPAAEPFMSEIDIHSGHRGQDVIARNLEDCDIGIVCLTRTNVERPWVNFEAGAISKRLGKSTLIPFYIGMRRSDLPVHSPFHQFQDVSLDERYVLKMVLSINRSVGPEAENDAVIEDRFEGAWSRLEGQVQVAIKQDRLSPPEFPDQPDVSLIVTETLNIVRSQQAEIIRIRQILRRSRRLNLVRAYAYEKVEDGK